MELVSSRGVVCLGLALWCGLSWSRPTWAARPMSDLPAGRIGGLITWIVYLSTGSQSYLAPSGCRCKRRENESRATSAGEEMVY